jgi:hypothetical protein
MLYLTAQIIADFYRFSSISAHFSLQSTTMLCRRLLCCTENVSPEAGNGNHCRPQAQGRNKGTPGPTSNQAWGRDRPPRSPNIRSQASRRGLAKREKELIKPGALDRLRLPDPTLAAVIDRYANESIKKIGRTKAQVLRAIKAYDVANKPCSEITSADLVAFANQLVIKVTPQTVGNYLSLCVYRKP